MIVYNKEVYQIVVDQLAENERAINELYGMFGVLSNSDQVAVANLIHELKVLNYEYEKYIIVYQSTASAEKVKNEYVVIQGDTLPKIAHRLLGDNSRWQEIYNYNNLKDVVLTAGDTLKIPEV